MNVIICFYVIYYFYSWLFKYFNLLLLFFTFLINCFTSTTYYFNCNWLLWMLSLLSFKMIIADDRNQIRRFMGNDSILKRQDEMAIITDPRGNEHDTSTKLQRITWLTMYHIISCILSCAIHRWAHNIVDDVVSETDNRISFESKFEVVSSNS